MEQQVAVLIPASDGDDRLTEAERGVCGTGETTSGIPPKTAGQMLEERMSRTEVSVRDSSQAGGISAARAQEDTWS